MIADSKLRLIIYYFLKCFFRTKTLNSSWWWQNWRRRFVTRCWVQVARWSALILSIRQICKCYARLCFIHGILCCFDWKQCIFKYKTILKNKFFRVLSYVWIWRTSIEFQCNNIVCLDYIRISKSMRSIRSWRTCI